MIQLSIEVPSITVHNVWDLPLWAWRAYASYIDALEQQAREANRGR